MRIASLALGTGDLDCTYHFALPELVEAVKLINNDDQMDMLNTLVQGRRLPLFFYLIRRTYILTSLLKVRLI